MAVSDAERLAYGNDWPLAKRPGFLIRRLHQIHMALFAQYCGDFGVTPVQYSVLSALAARGSADQTTIASDVLLDRTTTTGALRRLQARGLVERVVDASDRRARACSITEKGRVLLAEMEEAARAAHHATVAALNKKERAQFIALLNGLVDSFSAVPVSPTPDF